MNKNSVCCTPYFRNHTSYDFHLWYTYVKWWYLKVLSSFFQNFGFSGCQCSKGAKNGSKWQLILLPFISQEPYIILLWFSVHMCEMVTCPVPFFIFPKVCFSGEQGKKKGKKGLKITRKSVSLCISGTAPHMIVVFGAHGVKWWYLQHFLSLFWNLIFQGFFFFFFWGKEVKRVKNDP